jgi:hypothetical protein
MLMLLIRRQPERCFTKIKTARRWPATSCINGYYEALWNGVRDWFKR